MYNKFLAHYMSFLENVDEKKVSSVDILKALMKYIKINNQIYFK